MQPSPPTPTTGQREKDYYYTIVMVYRKFRHPTHYKEHVKKHGEAVQFACDLCEVRGVGDNDQCVGSVLYDRLDPHLLQQWGCLDFF